jgi:hypothetical protein
MGREIGGIFVGFCKVERAYDFTDLIEVKQLSKAKFHMNRAKKLHF